MLSVQKSNCTTFKSFIDKVCDTSYFIRKLTDNQADMSYSEIFMFYLCEIDRIYDNSEFVKKFSCKFYLCLG